MTTTFWFGCHDHWADDEPTCFVCGLPGVDTRTDGRLVSARSWKNPATWVAELEDGVA